jgi:hypothetical protein
MRPHAMKPGPQARPNSRPSTMYKVRSKRPCRDIPKMGPFFPKLPHTKHLAPDDGTWVCLATGLRRLAGARVEVRVSRNVISIVTVKDKRGTAGND